MQVGCEDTEGVEGVERQRPIAHHAWVVAQAAVDREDEPPTRRKESQEERLVPARAVTCSRAHATHAAQEHFSRPYAKPGSASPRVKLGHAVSTPVSLQ